MKNFFLTLLVAVMAFGLGIPDVEAKRLGGGSSFGMKRQATPQSAPRQPAATQQTPGAAAAAQPRRSWMGPIAGLAAGLGLAALFSHLGLGEEMASFMMILLLAGAAFLIFRMVMRRRAEAQGGQRLQYAGAPAGGASRPDSGFTPRAADTGRAPLASAPIAGGMQKAVAEGFDSEGFARQAKLNFIRLQAANDAGNLDDIREFTTPEVFAEIQLQLSERGAATQRTDVVELNAEVVDVAEEGNRYIVSVRFNGLLREEEGAAPAPFDEIWHLTKPVSGAGGWLIAGIQQTGD